MRTLLLLALAAPLPARASDVYINLAGRAGQKGIALGLLPFSAENPKDPEQSLLAKRLRDVVREDLLFSRYVALDEEGPAAVAGDLKTVLPAWKTRGALWLLTARASAAEPKIAVSVRLTNVESGEAAFERFYRQDSKFLRSLAHRVSDDVIQALTGKPGIARTQIAFSNDRTGRKELYLMDYDGDNLRPVTAERSIVLLPRLSPDGRLMAYTSYRDGNPDLYVYELLTGRTRLISGEQGLNVAGGFSPDGGQLLMTLSLQKNPNVFVKSLSDGTLTRLTAHTGVDSSPTFSPDGGQAAFVSDRSGNPQLYLLDMNTQRTKRLTRAMNWSDSPAWSPTGEWVVFAGRSAVKDPIDIFIVDVTGNQVRQLTHGEGSNENPCWSPDGRFIAFSSTRGGRSELYIMDADGSAPHRLADVPGNSTTPSWAPIPAR